MKRGTPMIYYYVIMCMVCGSLGRLTMLRAYSFSVFVLGTSGRKGKSSG